MNIANVGRGRACCGFIVAPRKKLMMYLLLLVLGVVTTVLITMASSGLRREDTMTEKLAGIQTHLQFLEAQYRRRQEQVRQMQNKVAGQAGEAPLISEEAAATYISPEVKALLKNMSGTRAAAGIHPKPDPQLRIPFVYQLLPHLMDDPNSLKPAYHLKSERTFADVVVGIPTVKRDKESYLRNTITALIEGLTAADYNSTLIVVMVGETDLEYVLNTARQIEAHFSKDLESGLLEVISPSAAYYPDFDHLPDTLGDSHKRVKWRSKQNLDTIFLMAHAQSKGTLYLMLEDDVLAQKKYMQDIKHFTASTTVLVPNWFFIEFCQVGGIGKLFRSSDLIHFITYVQLFYSNMPIDWLLESYLADRVCAIDKTSKVCGDAKANIRPKFKSSLFQHIGQYSSLQGKIQKVKDPKFGTVPTFYPHENPSVKTIRTDIQEVSKHTLKMAYRGQTYFWGIKPKKGDLLEFWFKKPTPIGRYLFRSGSAEHVFDKFYDTAVEVLPHNHNGTFTVVGGFDEFGLAAGELEMGLLSAIRLRVNKNSTYWVILSEIELKATERVNTI